MNNAELRKSDSMSHLPSDISAFLVNQSAKIDKKKKKSFFKMIFFNKSY